MNVLAAVLEQLAPFGTLYAALNRSNFLLVSGQNSAGEWQGVAPALARAVAAQLGTGVRFVPYGTPGELADAVNSGAWTIGMIGADPLRAADIVFSPAYAEIEASYLVPPGSALQSVDEIDRPGKRIAVFARSAYDLWLERNLKYAELIRADSFDAAFQRFRNEGLDALACITPKLIEDAHKWPGSRVLAGHFMTVQQAVGTSTKNVEAAAFLKHFVEESKASGLVQQWIDASGMQGLIVAGERSTPA